MQVLCMYEKGAKKVDGLLYNAWNRVECDFKHIDPCLDPLGNKRFM
jgi:DNA relaxase NicK